jgi:hypothetical protein
VEPSSAFEMRERRSTPAVGSALCMYLQSAVRAGN